LEGVPDATKQHLDFDYCSARASGESGLQTSAPGGESPSSLPIFFEKRGVTAEVWKARPYLPYRERDPEGVARSYWPQTGHTSYILNQSGGIVIPRFAPDSMRLPKVYAELRPWEPVFSSPPHWHYHGDPERIPEGGLVYPTTGKHLPRKFILDPHSKSAVAHIFKHHRDGNVHTVHKSLDPAKYIFPARVDARRIDMHTQAALRFANASHVFFVIEGCIKADAVLCAGGAVLSVPSVSEHPSCRKSRGDIFAVGWCTSSATVIGRLSRKYATRLSSAREH
jgi:hypothetical protein